MSWQLGHVQKVSTRINSNRQDEAASRMESWWMHEFVFPRMEESIRASALSQGGSRSSPGFDSMPHLQTDTVGAAAIPGPLFPPSPIAPLPVRPIHQFGHHRAACARAGILGKRGFALESVIARISRAAGGRVTTNVLLRELNFGLMNEADGRRLEVVADGLPLFGGAQFAVDTTVVSALRSDGTARPRAAHTAGVALEAAPRRKERRYPELVGSQGEKSIGGIWGGSRRPLVR